jgi:serine/threonine protein kinase
MIGTSLSHYRITEKLGQGGMGEVYRAEDIVLGRQVAIKVLPDVFAADPERMARFEREAKLLASLNHPNIASIYGLEQADGKRFLVLELVEGQTLAGRLHKGPLPIEEALEVCRQIAEGLEAAHEKGVIHRDLKPANVKVTPEGKVKVLDFGLAKAFYEQATPTDASKSPTITDQMTAPGVILGTAAYMSPEQARGKSVDKRADIWAFGCVLFECLTAKRAFQGDTITETVAAILKSEPDWTLLPADTPAIRSLLQRCLQKDPVRRLRDIGDARIELDETSSEPLPAERVPGGLRKWGVSKAALIAAAVLSVIALAALVSWWLRWLGSDASAPTARITLSLSADNSLILGSGVAISPDGQTLAFIARSPEGSRLYIRHLDEWEPRSIPGTEDASGPFFSPDGKWVAFGHQGGLEKIPSRSGSPQPICRPSGSSNVIGGTWGPDSTIIFATWPDVALWRVSADGGTPEILTRSKEGSGIFYLWPERLLGDQAVLFTVRRQEGTSIAALVPGVSEPRTIIKSAACPRYLPTGHLLYVSQGHLLAVPFDVKRLEIHGGATIVIDDVTENEVSADYDVSTNGTLVYVPSRSSLDTLVWKDRRGVTTPLGLNPRRYSAPALSPDGRRLAVTVSEGSARNVWIGSVEREPLTRLTFGNDDWSSLWTHDGQRLFVNSGQNGRYNIFWMPTDGSGKAERLTDSVDAQQATSLSPNGDVLLFTDNFTSGYNIWQLSVGRKETRPLVKTRTGEAYAVFSPDGRWVAYESDESGRGEVYVQAYPWPGLKMQISVAGGTEPRWNRNGRELFYQTATAIMAVPVLDGQNLRPGSPVRLFASDGRRGYDVSPDGHRFLIIEKAEAGSSPSRLKLVLNWFEELKRLVPTGKQ